MKTIFQVQIMKNIDAQHWHFTNSKLAEKKINQLEQALMVLGFKKMEKLGSNISLTDDSPAYYSSTFFNKESDMYHIDCREFSLDKDL